METSNAMLRKQLITSINNEEISRKEMIEVKSSSGSIIDGRRGSRNSTMYNHSFRTLNRQGREINSNSGSQSAVSNQLGHKDKKSLKFKESFISEINKLN